MRRTLAVVMVLILLMLGNNAAAVVQLPYSSEPTSALWKLYDPELHYWYQQLTEAEKRLFSARYDCIALGQADLWDYPCGRLTLENRERIDYVLMMDCPELLYYPQARTLDSLRYGRIQAPDEAFCAQHAALLPDRLAECMAALDAIRRQPEWGETDFEKEIARLSKELENLRKEMNRSRGMLNNAGFIAKAPAQLVQQEKDKLEAAAAKAEALEKRIAELKEQM